MRIFKKINFLFVLLSLNVIYAQGQKDIVAKVGNIPITKEEFQKRFDFTPHPGSIGDVDSTLTKREFLHTLIAEKLLAGDAFKKGFESTAEYLKAYNYVRDFYLRDALYTVEVKNKTVIPDSALVIGRERMRRTLMVKFIFSRDEKEITDIYRSLMTHATFDSVLSTRPENAEQKKAIEITFGTMNEEVENYLYSLKLTEITPPIELPEGWYIFRLYSGTIKDDLQDIDIQKVERVVRDRMYDRTYQAFYKKFFKGVVVDADRSIFYDLWKALYKYIKENDKSLVLKNKKYTLFEKEINAIRGTFSQQRLNNKFIKFSEKPVTFNDFLDFMSSEGFEFVNKDSAHVGSRLNTLISTYIQNEILAREALKRGYDKLADIESELKIWREYFLANLDMKQIYKKETVTDEEAREFYNKNNKIVPRPAEFKISEILVDSLDTVNKIFSELDKGKDFKELAARYAREDSTRNSGSETSSNQIDSASGVWQIVSKMKVGEVYGPIKVRGGFSIIKLLKRDEPKQERVETFEEAKNDIKDILQTEKMNKKLIDYTARLAMDTKLEINDKVLNSTKVNTVNMIVYRRFGFGGQQIAVPYTPNFSDWYKKYLELRKSLSF